MSPHGEEELLRGIILGKCNQKESCDFFFIVAKEVELLLLNVKNYLLDLADGIQIVQVNLSLSFKIHVEAVYL
jgi:hypothetical protein